MTYKFDKEIYSLQALLKAAYSFTDKAYIHLDSEDKYYIVDVEMKEGQKQIGKNEFKNELLAQMVRQMIDCTTKDIRELLMARAFSSTIIERKNVDALQDSPEKGVDESQMESILGDWFDEYE